MTGQFRNWFDVALAVAAGVLLGAILGGCATTAPYSRVPRPCQEEAVDVVWRGCFGRTDRPPGVWWVPPAAQNCGRTVNGARGFMTPAGCAGSVSYGATADIELVDFHAGWQGTGLAHECLHVAQAREGLPPDTQHSPAFMAAVNQCNVRLAEAALCAPEPRPSAMAAR